MVGIYNYTVILTLLSVVSAAVGITFSVSGNVQIGLICLGVCGICDAFDGTVASLKKNRTDYERAYGMNLDSLSDIVAFGILPAMIFYGFGFHEFWAYIIMAFYIICAISRLAFFDVEEVLRKETNPGKRTHFTGLPVTNASVIFPIVAAISLLTGLPANYLCLIFLILTGIAFITPFKLKKLYLPWLLVPMVFVIAAFVVILTKGGSLNA